MYFIEFFSHISYAEIFGVDLSSLMSLSASAPVSGDDNLPPPDPALVRVQRRKYLYWLSERIYFIFAYSLLEV